MFTIGQRPGGRTEEWVEPMRSPTDRVDCNDLESPPDHHPGIHLEPSKNQRGRSTLWGLSSAPSIPHPLLSRVSCLVSSSSVSCLHCAEGDRVLDAEVLVDPAGRVG